MKRETKILNKIKTRKKTPNTDFSDIGYSKFQSELSKLEDKISFFGKEYGSVKKNLPKDMEFLPSLIVVP